MSFEGKKEMNKISLSQAQAILLAMDAESCCPQLNKLIYEMIGAKEEIKVSEVLLKEKNFNMIHNELIGKEIDNPSHWNGGN